MDDSIASSIHQLPPSPIKDDPRPFEDLSDQQQPGSGPRLNEMKTDYLASMLSGLRTTHRYSAYTFSAFSIIHFLNTGIAPLLAPIRDLTFADENLTAARALYQNSYASEAILVFGALGVHVVSGFAIRVIRICREYIWYKHHARIPRFSWNSMTGYIIIPFIAGHIFTNRYVPWKLDIDITSSLVGHAITKNPVIGWTVYTSFVTLSSLHIANGLCQWLGWSKKVKHRVNFGVVSLWLLGLAKVVAHGVVEGYKGRQYDAVQEAIASMINSYAKA